MAGHKLEGDLSKFAVLDHIDTGRPKTTDLDSITEVESGVDLVGLSSCKAQESGERLERSAMDREDIVTVKYLPIEMSPSTESPSSVSSQPPGMMKMTESQVLNWKNSAKLSPKEDFYTTAATSITNATSANETSRQIGEEDFAKKNNYQEHYDQSIKTGTSALKTTTTKEENFSSSVTTRYLEGEGAEEIDVEENPKDLNVRIVEHIRKNLTLFETNREIYQLKPNNKVEYENSRGHLQTLLDAKKLSSQSDSKSSSQSKHHHYQPPTSTAQTKPVTDQYTQYRPSDLAAIYNQQSFLYHPQQLKPTQPSSIRRSTGTKEPIKGKKIQLQDKKPSTKINKSFQEFIKKPLELFAKKANDPTTSRRLNPLKKENQPGEEQYKVPVRQPEVTVVTVDHQRENTNFSTSQSLYLTPAPDYTVHIATKLVKDIILAHKRAGEKFKAEPQSVKSKLLKQFNSLRRRHSNNNSSSRSLGFRERSRSFISTSTNKPAKTETKQETYRRSKGERFDTIEKGQISLGHLVSEIRAKVKMPSGKTDKANIIDNKDGTVKISYEPKEIGQHEISLRYNDEPIDESPIVFYVDAVGSSKKKITAFGSGLTRGLVGETCKFTINTGGLGSAKLNVIVEGPSKTQVNLKDNKDGTIIVSYTPLLPGEYKIKISFDGKQVVGSPFTTLISDEGRQRSHLNLGRGSEQTLDLKISQEDLKTLDAVIQAPCGLEEPCALKLIQNGQLAIVFTPREQGDHLVNVRRRGNHVSGSPFKFDVLSRDIGDAKQVKVSGKGLKEGKTGNVENEIIINTREAGFGGLSVSMEGCGRTEILSKETNVTDGTIRLSYKAHEPGMYNLIVKYADHIVPGSPFSIKVTGQGTNNQRESMKKFRKLAAISEVNSECNFSFKLPGVSAYDLSARIHSPQGNAEDGSIKDKGDYVYLVSFTPKEVGLYSLSIRNKDIHIDGSPFPFTCGPFNMLDMGPHKVRCGGPGLLRGPCNKWNEFNVYTREAGPGQLTVLLDGPSKAELQYTDRADGSCHVGYKVSEPGEYRISVLFNDQEVPESPFRAFIMPLTGDVAKIELGPLPPESMIQLQKPFNMTVIMNGAKGNVEGKVRLPSGQFEDCFSSPIDAENWGVRFIPRELGIHQIHIKFNKGSTHIPQSPFNIRVGQDNADPASVVAHGHGLKQAIVNLATDFTVETCNAGHALLEINIEGPSKVSMGCAEIDEGYKVNYTPLAPGEYLIGIKYNGCHIGGSPYKIRAQKPSGVRTIADVGAHEIATLAIATTDREAKQKVENMPKFKSDASRIYCKGMGLKKAFAGKPNTLTVNCSEAGFNMIYASFLGPTRNTIHECSVKHMGGSIYEVKYTCKDRGDAILVVKYGDEQIPGSPFRLECV